MSLYRTSKVTELSTEDIEWKVVGVGVNGILQIEKRKYIKHSGNINVLTGNEKEVRLNGSKDEQVYNGLKHLWWVTSVVRGE